MENIFNLLCERDSKQQDNEYDMCCSVTEEILKEAKKQKDLEEEIFGKREKLMKLESKADYEILVEDNKNLNLKIVKITKEIEEIIEEREKIKKTMDDERNKLDKTEAECKKVVDNYTILHDATVQTKEQLENDIEINKEKKLIRDNFILQLNNYEERITEFNNRYKILKSKKNQMQKLSPENCRVNNLQLIQKSKSGQSIDIKAVFVEDKVVKRSRCLSGIITAHPRGGCSSSSDRFGYHFDFGSQIYSMCFSPTNPLVAIGGADKCVHVLRTDKQMIASTSSISKSGIMAVAYSPTGMRLASASFDHNLFIYDGLSSGFITQTSIHRDSINDCMFITDHNIITAGRDLEMRNFDITRMETKSFIKTKSSPCSLCNPKGDICIAAGFKDGKVRWWDTTTNYFALEMMASRSEVYQVLETGGVCQVAALCRNSFVILDKRMPERKLNEMRLTGIDAFDHMKAGVSQGSIVIGDKKGNVHMIDIATMKETSVVSSNHKSQICTVCCHPAIGSIVTGDVNGSVTVWI